MKTQVEIFELTDVVAETPEQCTEAQELIAKLGLEGQQPVTSSDISTGTRFPYRLMTDEERFVYMQLCPEREDVRKFRNEPIPLEVLKTLAYAKSLNDPRIEYIEVWSASSARVKDPVLVGRKNSYANEIYILARWGAELLPLEVLLPDAIKIWWAKRQDALHDIQAQVAQALTKSMPLGVPKERDNPYLSL